MTYKARFEQNTANKIAAAVLDSPTCMVQKTIQHYTVVFAAGVLPMKKRNKKKIFCWENCEELNKLAELNRRINSGLSLKSLRNDFARLKKSVEELEGTLSRMKREPHIYGDVIGEIETTLNEDTAKLRDTIDTLDIFEKVMGKTYVQGLIDEHKPKLQADYVPNGVKLADTGEVWFKPSKKL